jgi:FKBP-type peptidyl-prolyl cis-trans isomerase (trigger factor)
MSLERPAERNAVSEPVERPAQDGDLVTIKLSDPQDRGRRQESTLIRERSVPIL